MTRREAIILGFLYGGYLVIATLYPFELSGSAAHGFSQSFFGPLNTTDFILNVLLFIPFGILLYLGLALNRSKPWTILLTSLVAAAISLLIELFQVYFPRNPSGYDVISNTLGAGCGALVSALLPSRCFELIARLWHMATRSWVAVLVAVLLGAAPAAALARSVVPALRRLEFPLYFPNRQRSYTRPAMARANPFCGAVQPWPFRR